jgi:hypothetical protein
MAITAFGHLSDPQRDGRPAIAILKGECPRGEGLMSLVGQMFADKGIARSTIRYLQQHALLAPLVGHLLMQAPPSSGVARQLAGHQAVPLPLPDPLYTGSHRENREIDHAIFRSGQQRITPGEESMRATTWRGAAGTYSGGGLTVPSELRNVSVLIIGAGAAGLLVGRALANAGLQRIVILEQRGSAGLGGIWGMETPKRILHAVPFPLSFEQVLLKEGPRPGQEITSFLHTLVSPHPSFHWPAFPRVLCGEVVRVKPGDLSHTVIYLDEHGQEKELVAPVVINAIGVGEPLSPSWGGAMTTDLAPHEAGVRWQEVWSEQEAQRYHRRKLVFVSLSNATLSMLWQIHEWNRRGMQIDYHVISHYPDASLAEPHARIEHKGRTYRLYRDLEGFQLLRMAGDMSPYRRAFEEARANRRITSHVTHWTLSQQGPQRFVVVAHENGKRSIPCDDLYTLIGYGPRASTLQAMGLQVNHPYLGAASQDYDGEAQREPGATGRARNYPGYFCLGIRNGFNDNEVLLPGLLYRLPNLVAGVLLRAAEYAAQRRSGLTNA